MESPSIIFHPIGYIKTSYTSKYSAPRQPSSSNSPSIGIITLNQQQNFEQALEDLDGFDYIWILFVFDQNKNWKPKVLPPNSGRKKHGVFATRSPHRPNPIGLSLCKLLEIQGRTLHVENPDMLDGTPILDIKPYIPHAESFPGARTGWIDGVNELSTPTFTVTFSSETKKRLSLIDKKNREDILFYVTNLLSRDPFPHPYRRIKKESDGTFVLSVKLWRFRFEITKSTVQVLDCWKVQEK